jgi:hypothetical protein
MVNKGPVNEFKSCPNGHWYKQELPACPYCPGNSSNAVTGGDFDKTQLGSSGSMSNDTTRAVNTMNVDHSKTQVHGASTESAAPDFERTFIGGVAAPSSEGAAGGEAAAAEPRKARKLVGWLVSYTLDPMGVDFRLYEGNNSIGRNAENNITITRDSTISAAHANILYRESQGFFIKDEMSANGTFINGEELEIGKAFSIKDGDEIRMAKTVFKFKSCVK